MYDTLLICMWLKGILYHPIRLPFFISFSDLLLFSLTACFETTILIAELYFTGQDNVYT